MGTCFGHLKRITKKRKRRLFQLDHSRYNKNDEKVELHFLVEEEELQTKEPINEKILQPKRLCHRICSFLKPKCYKHIRGAHLQLVEAEEDSWEESSAMVGAPDITEGVQLVTLDVRSLRTQPTPPSSVDLEWEHEGVMANISSVCQRRLLSTTEECSLGSGLEGSPAESLEWDACDPMLDTDTEQLISEIERLTARALRETGGDWAYR